MSNHVAGMDTLEARQMLFAQPIASDAGTTKRSVALTDAGVYFQMQPTSLGNTEASDTRKYVRLSRATNTLETITPAKGTWDLSNLEFARALGGDTVLLHFDDGSMWSVRDGSKKAEKLIDIESIDYEGAAAIGHTLYFRGRGERGTELYATDGTPKGTRALPELRTTGDGDAGPKRLTPFGNQLLLTASTDAKPHGQLLRWDGKAFRTVDALKGSATDIAVADGKVVVVSDGKLATLSKDLKTATFFATSRATDVDHLTAIGKDVAFLSADGVYRSDLTTRGTLRLGDAPLENHYGYTTDVEIDPSGYLLHAYTGVQVSGTVITTFPIGGGGTPAPSPTPPAVYRLDAKSMTKVLDGSYSKAARVGETTYFIAGTGYAAGGAIVRLNKDGSTTSLDVGANAARMAADARSLVVAAGTTLYVVDPKSTLGAIRGGLYSDDNLNRKYNGSDDPIDGSSVFVDYDRDGRRDENEPTATIQYGGFTFTAVREGTYDLRADVGSNYRGSVAVGRVTVKAREVAEAKLLATPLFSTIRVEAFADVDGDGARDKGEGPAAGYSAFIDENGNKKRDDGERVAVTGADGVATFAKLPPGLSRVRVQRLNADDVFTTATSFNLRTSGDQTAVAVVGVVGTTADPKTGSIRGQLATPYLTTGLGDVKVALYRDDVYVKQTLASDGGRFDFKYLTRGNYDVRVAAAGRYGASGSGTLEVKSGAQVKATVTLDVKQAIAGVAFLDKNGNGRRDAGEQAVAGVPVFASDADSAATTTDAQGHYALYVPFGFGLSTQSAVYVWSRSDDDTTSYSESFAAIPDGSAFVAQTAFDLPLFRLP